MLGLNLNLIQKNHFQTQKNHKFIQHKKLLRKYIQHITIKLIILDINLKTIMRNMRNMRKPILLLYRLQYHNQYQPVETNYFIFKWNIVNKHYLAG